MWGFLFLLLFVLNNRFLKIRLLTKFSLFSGILSPFKLCSHHQCPVEGISPMQKATLISLPFQVPTSQASSFCSSRFAESWCFLLLSWLQPLPTVLEPSGATTWVLQHAPAPWPVPHILPCFLTSLDTSLSSKLKDWMNIMSLLYTSPREESSGFVRFGGYW